MALQAALAGLVTLLGVAVGGVLVMVGFWLGIKDQQGRSKRPLC